MIKNILVTGGNGQVGSELRQLAPNYPDFHFVFTDVKDLDITNLKAVKRFFKDNNIQYCINCAAYTAVDKAESDVALCRLINKTGAKNLALACAENGAWLAHISTDYVYHNNQNTPFKEGDKEKPQGIYALTKLEGDKACLAANPKTLVFRTSWVYSTFGNNFVKTMIRLGNERPELNIIFDQIGTPTYAFDLAKAILDVFAKIDNKTIDSTAISGVYHYSNEGITSWYDFAKAIFEIEGIKVKANPIETSQYPTPAKRPPFSAMNKGKVKATFGIEIPHWRDSLTKCLAQLRQG